MNSNILSRFFLFVAGFLFLSQANAQMYVGPSTYVIVNNQYVYITKELELNAANSNFYLRKEGQLLQGSVGALANKNKGLGKLSVFQEGSSNEYQYNYWCSPVGNASATLGNESFGISMFNRPTDLTSSTAAITTPLAGYNGVSNPLKIEPYWVWKFLSSGAYSDWVHASAASTIAPGEGFTMKGTSGTDTTLADGGTVQNNPDGKHQRYDFRGKPNDGDITINVATGKFTLTGNPYPSAIDLNAFLQDAVNSSCTGIAYFWEHDKTVNSHYLADYKGGYGSYSPAGDTYVPAVFYTYDGSGGIVTTTTSPGIYYKRRFSPIGQGFMISGAANGTVQMRNSYRVFVKENVTNSEFEKQTATKNSAVAASLPQIRFNNFINNIVTSQLVLPFLPESTDGIDRAMDAESPNNGPANVYFVIDNREFVINVLPFNIDKKIAIGFRNTAQANYKITVNQILELPEVQNVYLHDKITNNYYDIKNSFYDLTLPAGVNNSQYEITFKNGSLGVADLVSQSFVVYQNNSTKNLMINNPKQMELATCGLYDIAGKLIFIKKQLGTDLSYKFSTSGLSDGVYIVKLTTNDETEIGQKIIIKN